MGTQRVCWRRGSSLGQWLGDWVWNPENRQGVTLVLLLTLCATSGKSLNLSELPFSTQVKDESSNLGGLGYLRVRQTRVVQCHVLLRVLWFRRL